MLCCMLASPARSTEKPSTLKIPATRGETEGKGFYVRKTTPPYPIPCPLSAQHSTTSDCPGILKSQANQNSTRFYCHALFHSTRFSISSSSLFSVTWERRKSVTWSKVLRGCSDPILCRAHGSNYSQFPDEGPVLTPLLSLVEWNSPRNKKRGHEGGSQWKLFMALSRI